MDDLESSKKYYLDVNLEDAETSIRANLKDAARSVIAVGHYLKVIRDKELYREVGYENVWDYAAERFGFSKSTASRYMARNDKFSVGGNSPVLAEEFREYSKAQLQEMLSLDAEQLENVTPDMTVKQIRELKKPKELPYFEIDGQIEIQDILKADQEGQKTDPEIEEKLSAYGLPKRVYPADSLLTTPGCKGDDGRGYDCFSCHLECGIRQEYCHCVDATCGFPFPCQMIDTGKYEILEKQIGERCQFIDLNSAAHRAGDGSPVPCCKDCETLCEHACENSGKCVATSQQPTAADALQETTGTAAEKQQKETRVNPEEKHVEQRRTENNKKQQEESVATSQQNEKQDSPTIRGFIKSWKEILPEEFRRAMRAMREGKSTKEKAQQIQKELSPYGVHSYDCSEYSFSWHSFEKGMDWEVDGKKIHLTYARLASELLCMYDPQSSQFDEKPDIDDENADRQQEKENTVDRTDLELLREMLERKQQLLEKCRAIPGIYETDERIRKQKLEVAAVNAMICSMENSEEAPGAEKTDQPELPQLKNNEQRAAFIDAYETWPLWIDTQETGERYYRYDLPDGTSFVIKTYHAMLYDYNRSGCHYKEGYGENEQYLLEPGKFFRDCRTNRSMLIEKLKELQKNA